MIFDLNDSELKVLRDAAERWGDVHEERMAIEELSETITAISHFKRGRVNIQDVVDELGDAFVCVCQLIYRHNSELLSLEAAIAASLGKLYAKLEHDDPNYGQRRS